MGELVLKKDILTMSSDRLKIILLEMYQYIHYGYNIPMELMLEMHNIYCSTCGSCGKLECCPPTTCKFGLNYINHLNEQIENLKKENKFTRKALEAYIKKDGWPTNESTIDREIEFYGKS